MFQPSWSVTVAIRVNSAMTTCVTVATGVVKNTVLCLSSMSLPCSCHDYCFAINDSEMLEECVSVDRVCYNGGTCRDDYGDALTHHLLTSSCDCVPPYGGSNCQDGKLQTPRQ